MAALAVALCAVLVVLPADSLVRGLCAAALAAHDAGVLRL